jgi:hypothetical protein
LDDSWRFVIDDDEALLIRIVVGLIADGDLAMETNVSGAFCKAKGLHDENLKSPTEHSSYRNTRDHLTRRGLVERKPIGQTHSLEVTAIGLQALRFDRQEIYEAQEPQESRMYVDQIWSSMSHRAEESHKLFAIQPTITINGPPALVPVVMSMNLVASTNEKKYLDAQGLSVICNATGTSVVMVGQYTGNLVQNDLEAFSAEFTQRLAEQSTKLAVELAEKHGLGPSTLSLRFRGNVELRIFIGDSDVSPTN